ncbi:MAG TPA: AAA family ATPase [Thermomicrobiales bacterium]|jgi:chloramphenicol 3-O phosphotransferase
MPTNTIIYINGPSSAGKTQLALALQETLPEPYLYLSIDTLIGLMPAKVNDWTGQRTTIGYSFQPTTDDDGNAIYRVVAGPYARQIPRAFRAIVVTLAQSGLNLIIDDIAFGREQVQQWRAALQGYAVLWIGVTAAVETLEARERARGDRMVGSARDQAARVHTGVTYNLLLDTTATTTIAAVGQILAHFPALNNA